MTTRHNIEEGVPPLGLRAWSASSANLYIVTFFYKKIRVVLCFGKTYEYLCVENSRISYDTISKTGG